MRRIHACFLGILALAGAATAQVRIYVDASKPAGGDGLSWATAHRYLQDALAQAAAVTPIPGQTHAEVWVREGTYYPDEGAGITQDDRLAFFIPADGVAMYGGFKGDETALAQRDIDAHPTILSADLKQDDQPGFVNTADNAFHVVQFWFVGEQTILDGFTLRDGNANGEGTNPDAAGGGLSAVFSSGTISRCTFTDNFGRLPGGGLRLASSNSLVINCRFIRNWSTTAGGGMGFSSSDPLMASPRIIGCEFRSNFADEFSGALRISLQQPTTIEVSNCTFSGNYAKFTGGIGTAMPLTTSKVVFTNCIIWGNQDDSGSGEAAQLSKVNKGTYELRNSCIQGLTDAFAPVHCISTDPRFADDLGPDNEWGTGDEDLRLFVGSPAIDAGDNAALPADTLDFDGDGDTLEPVPFDAAGVLRRYDDTQTPDTGIGTPPLVDMGAFEFVPIDPDKPGDRLWINNSGGAYAVASSWFPAKVPGASDNSIFDLDAAYTVDIGGNKKNRRLIVSRGLVTFDLNAKLIELTEPAEDAARIGPFVGQPAALRIRDGELRAASLVSIGGAEGSQGTLLLDEPGSRLHALALAVRSGSLVIDNGGYAKASTILVLRHGRIEGESTAATLDTFLLSNFGEVSPGGEGIGTLELSGAYAQIPPILTNASSSGALRIQLAGPTSHDALRAAGATLGGGLFVDLAGGFAPGVADSFPFLTATGTVSGRFDVAYLPAIPGDPEHYLRVDYGARAGEVSIKVESLSELIGFAFGPGASLAGTPNAGTLADADGDGLIDLIICAPDPDNPTTQPGSVLILRNKGNDGGIWQGFDLAGITQLTTGINPVAVAATDVDLEPGVEIAVVNQEDDEVWIFQKVDGTWIHAATVPCNDEPTSIDVYEGPIDSGNSFVVGGMTFPDPPNVPVGVGIVTVLANKSTAGSIIFEPDPLPAGPRPSSVTAKPLGSGQLPSIVSGNGHGSSVSVFPGGEGFGPTITFPAGDDPVQVKLGDLNGDGLADIACANASGTVSILINLDEFIFAPAVNLPVGPDIAGMALVDADGDGDLDIVVIADDATGQPTIFTIRNDTVDGDAAFSHPEPIETDGTPLALLVGDLNDDGQDDVLAINLAGEGPGDEISVYLGAPTPACGPDCELDGDLDIFDFLCFQGKFFEKDPYADYEKDGDWDLFDYLAFQNAYVTGCD